LTRELSASSAQVSGTLDAMAALDTDAMLARFRDRASAVKKRPLPPVAGEERQQFLQQAKLDYQDFAIIGDAEATVDDGILTLRIDLRPPDQRS
jgi:hypothetical protein